MIRGSLATTVLCVGFASCSASSPAPPQLPEVEPAAIAEPPEACPAEAPSHQSPAVFGAAGVEPEAAATCATEGSAWLPCHQHMHCGAEHSGAGICGGADCEVHTVHRMRKDGSAAAAVAHLHDGTVAGNCDPAQHHLMVRATFLDFADDCAAGAAANLTYCGSATGNNASDADHDGAVACAESGINPVSVRWCLEAACQCHPGSSAEAQVATFGDREATRVQGCPGQ